MTERHRRGKLKRLPVFDLSKPEDLSLPLSEKPIVDTNRLQQELDSLARMGKQNRHLHK